MRFDLKILFGSEARLRLLRELYARSQEDYPLRGLAAIAGVDPGQAHRLVRQLVDAGFCDQVVAGSYPRYRASQNPLLQSAFQTLFSAAGAQTTNPMQRIEDRSLLLHQAAVERLRRDPHALQRARDTLHRWIAKQDPEVPDALREWDDILKRPVSDIAEIALQRTQYGDRIRKSSPLSTLVTAEERRRAYATR